MSTSTNQSNTTVPAAPGPVRRIVTGHTAEGKSVILTDAAVEPIPFLGKGPTVMSDIFWQESAPADNSIQWKDTIKDHATEHVGPEGSAFRVVDLPPGLVSPFHRTVSLDYGILTQGTLTMILDDDKRVTLKAGDIFVQRGTIHGWHNEGTEWVRMYCVMLPAEKVKIGEGELDKVFQAPRK